MTRPGPDPRRRRTEVTPGNDAHSATTVVRRGSYSSGDTGRPLARSALWESGPWESGSRESTVTTETAHRDLTSERRHPDGPQPLRASWSPVPPDPGHRTRGDRHRPRAAKSSDRRAGADARSADPSAPASTRLGSGPASTDPPAHAESAGGEPPQGGRRIRRRSAVGWFFHRYGWRAYALPALVALTVVMIVQAFRPAATDPTAIDQQALSSPSVATTVTVQTVGPTTTVVSTAAAATAAAGAGAAAGGGAAGAAPSPASETVTTLATAPNPNGKFAAQIKAGALPPGGAFVPTGKGTWHMVKGTGKPVGKGPEKFTYSVEVEDGIQSGAADVEFAEAVDAALADPRSWIAGKQFTLQRVDSGTPSFQVSLTSQMTIRNPSLCGYGTPLEASCYNRTVGRVMINDARWTRGAVSFNGDLGLYRVYAINHEVGHALGFGHQICAENGGLAPVMMQQSFSTSNDDLHLLDPQAVPANHKECRFNAFPYPRGSGN